MLNFCCSYERLYAAGGFYEDASVAAAFVDLSAECRWLANLYPPYAYVRPLPAELVGRDPLFTAELYAQCTRWNADYERGASTDLFELTDGLLFNRCLYKAHGGAIVQMYETNKPADRHWRPDLDPAVDLRDIKQPHDPAMEFFYLGSIGSHNYGHWLIDDLMRARSLLVHFGTGRVPAIVLDAYDPVIDAVREQSLRSLLRDVPEVTIIFIDYKSAHFFPKLYFVSPATLHPLLKSPAGVGFLRDHFVERAPRTADCATAGGAKRVFVTRRARWRNVLNLDAVIAYFRDRAFTVVELEGLSFGDQVRAFASAEIVAGVMGAGMANTVFSPAGAAVVHLAPEGWKDPFLWDLAAVKHHRYSVVFGEPWKPEAPSFSSFTIDLAYVEQVAALHDAQ